MMDDRVLKDALIEAEELVLSMYEDGEYLFKKKVKRGIKRIIFREKHPFISYINRFAAMIVLALLLGGTIVLATSETARAAVRGWFNDIIGEIAIYTGQYDSSNDIRYYSIKEIVPPKYTFSLKDSYISENDVCEVFVNSEELYLYMYVANAKEGKNASILFDESDEVEIINVNGYSADHYYDDEDTRNAYVWQNEQGILFYIGGIISDRELRGIVDEFIKIYK